VRSKSFSYLHLTTSALSDGETDILFMQKMAVEIVITRHPLHAIQLTNFVKNEEQTDNLCSVCYQGRYYFRSRESMVDFAVV